MKNEYEIASWVSSHKRILDLAISIRKVKRQRIDNDSEDDDVDNNISFEDILQVFVVFVPERGLLNVNIKYYN